MFNKLINFEKELIDNQITEMIYTIHSIVKHVNGDQPLCKKHSAIYCAHMDFDYKLSFVKVSARKEGYPAELIKLLDELNLYLIQIIQKRLYEKDNAQLSKYLEALSSRTKIGF